MASGTVTFARPMVARSEIRLAMRDGRSVIALLRSIANTPGWMKLVPNIETITSTTGFATDPAVTTNDDLVVTGNGFEVLGSLRVAAKEPDGRLRGTIRGVAAGIGFDEGSGTVHPVKPRAWFDGRPGGPAPQPTTASEG